MAGIPTLAPTTFGYLDAGYDLLLKAQHWERVKAYKAYTKLSEAMMGESFFELEQRQKVERRAYYSRFMTDQYKQKVERIEKNKSMERWLESHAIPNEEEVMDTDDYVVEVRARPRPYRVYGGTKHWPAFKVARWRMEGELGSHAIWFDGKSSDSARTNESLRLLVIKEYEEKYGAVDCEPEVTFLDVPKEKDRFLDFLNRYCSK